MERRHQIFISSTFTDLKEERSELIQAALELDCIPAGMELFPATNEAAWELIKGVIDDSDYYCLVIGGRYGTTGPEGLSFTEQEYDYAVSKSMPLIAFLHNDPGKITQEKTEKTDIGKEKLQAFRNKVEKNHHCKYWNTASELGGLVSRGLVNLRKTHPADGWIRGRYAATPELLLELANLKTRIAELTTNAVRDAESDIAEFLSSGTDIYACGVSYKAENESDYKDAKIEFTWDQILRYVGPALLNECSETDFMEKLSLCAYHTIDEKIDHSSIVIPYVHADEIKVQLRALELMCPGTKRRAVSDPNSYWKLTARGEKRLISVQAIPKARNQKLVAAPLDNATPSLKK